MSFGPDDTEPAEMARGSVLCYSGSVYHGGGANRSEHTRIGLNITYNVAWLRQEENQYLSVPREVAATLADRPPAPHGLRPRAPTRWATSTTCAIRSKRCVPGSDRPDSQSPHSRTRERVSRSRAGRHYRGRHAGRDPSGHRRRLRRPLRGLHSHRQRGRGLPAEGTGGPGRVQRVLDRPLRGRVRGQVRRLPDRRVVHQAELRRAGGPHRQRGLLRARRLPGHRRRPGAGGALAARGPAARLRCHALQPRLRVEPGPHHVRQARLRRNRADSRCRRGRGCADLLAQPGRRPA